MKVSARSDVPAFAVMEVLAAAHARRAAGQDVIVMCAGEPAGGAAPAVRERAARAALTEELGYTPALGLPVLRAALAGHYRRWYDLDVDPRRIAVTTGSSGGFLLAFLTAFDPGDRVALTRPGYPAYRNLLRTLGCEVVEVPVGPATRYQPTPELLDAAAGDRPLDGLVLASPANPTGTAVDAAELAALTAWCGHRGVRLISDEIYHGLGYTTSPAVTAAPAVADGAVVASSFSKFWGMTGWRLGWLVLPDDLLAPVEALAGNAALCPPAPAQHAALAALSDAGYAAGEAAAEQYRASRAVVLDAARRLGWHRTAPADGAFYLYADLSDVEGPDVDSVDWCRRLLHDTGVALTPGTDFDAVDGHRWVRLSFAVAPDVAAEAVARIEAWQGARRP